MTEEEVRWTLQDALHGPRSPPLSALKRSAKAGCHAILKAEADPNCVRSERGDRRLKAEKEVIKRF